MAWNPIGNVKGPQGDEGKSAYQVWLDQGNTGTEEEFVASLQADITNSVGLPLASPAFNSDASDAFNVDLRQAIVGGDYGVGVWDEDEQALVAVEGSAWLAIPVPFEMDPDKFYTIVIDWHSVDPSGMYAYSMPADLIPNEWETYLRDVGSGATGRRIDHLLVGPGIEDFRHETETMMFFDAREGTKVYALSIVEGDNREVFTANGMSVKSDGKRLIVPGISIGGTPVNNIVEDPWSFDDYGLRRTGAPSAPFVDGSNLLAATDGRLPAWGEFPDYARIDAPWVWLDEPGYYDIAVRVRYEGKGDLTKRVMVGQFSCRMNFTHRRVAVAEGNATNCEFNLDWHRVYFGAENGPMFVHLSVAWSPLGSTSSAGNPTLVDISLNRIAHVES